MKRRTIYLTGLALFLLLGGFLALRYEVLESHLNDEQGEKYFAATDRKNDVQLSKVPSRRWTVEEDEPIVMELDAGNVEVSVREQGKDRIGELPEELSIFDRSVLEKRTVGKLSWKTGTAWKVETYYLRMDQPGEPGWTTKPIVWDFVVLGTEKLGEEEVFVVEAYPEDLTGMPYNPGGKVYISTSDHAVVALKDRVLEAGTVKDRYISFSDPGAGALSSLIPLELPPAKAKGNTFLDLGSYALGDPGPSAPKGTDKVAGGSDLMEVSFKANGVTVLQRWDTSNPVWPLYSSTPYRVSYLRKGS